MFLFICSIEMFLNINNLINVFQFDFFFLVVVVVGGGGGVVTRWGFLGRFFSRLFFYWMGRGVKGGIVGCGFFLNIYMFLVFLNI